MSSVLAAPPVTPPRLMTAEEFWDYCQLPENRERSLELRRGEVVELVRGEVVDVSRPTMWHGAVCAALTTELTLYARRTRSGCVIGNDAGLVLARDPDSVVGPDVAFYTHVTRSAEFPAKWSLLPPLLAVEVLSPSDSPGKVHAKVRDYLINGVRVVWLADPEAHSVTVFRPGQTLEVLDAAAMLTGGDELPGFACRVGDLFVMPGDAPDPA